MLYKCKKSIECSASTNNVDQQRSSIAKCCDTGNGADIELIIVGVAVSAC